MATYIQGLTDYIPRIQPFQPDYNFLSNVLQARQSKYDQNYNQLSSVYTSLLNSPMMRDSDIKRKDAFFKTIDQDIKKVSGMDLSLEQNSDTAMKLFSPFYDDKNLVNDMVTTKKYQQGLATHERFKGCIDHEKCGGEAWEPGLAEMNYKADEYRKTSDADALNFQMPSYTPYYNWKKDAVKLAKDLDFNVTQDSVSGGWIVKDTNGNLVKGGLYNLYKTMYGDDARVSANYKTKAYVERKTAVSNLAPQFGGNEDAAERAYISNTINNTSGRVTKMYNEFAGISQTMGEQTSHLTNKAKNQGITPDEEDTLQSLFQKKEQIDNTTNKLEETHNAIHNNADSDNIEQLRFRADSAAAFEAEQADMMDLANVMSLRGMKHEISVNPYALAETQSNLALRNAMTTAEYARNTGLIHISAKHAADLDKYDYEHGIKSGAIPTEPSTGELMQNAGWNTTDKAKDTPTAAADLDKKSQTQFEENANHGASDFLYTAFTTAKINAEKITSAKNYLDETIGKGWDKIKSKEELVTFLKNNKKNVSDVFNTTVQQFDPVKNKDTRLDWTNSFMKNSGGLIANIQVNQQANEAVAEHIANTNKDIVKSMKAQKSVDPLLYNADMLLTPAGYRVDKETFKNNYYHAMAQAGIVNPGNADNVYDVLDAKFNESYAKVGPISQGPILPTGASATTSTPIQYANISSDKPQDSRLIRVNSILHDITTSGEGTYKATIGNPGKDELSADSSPALEAFIPMLMSDLKSGNKTSNKPVISVIESPIAGNDENTSAITIKFLNPEYLADKKIWGTLKAPTPIAAYKNELLTNGITLSYNNTKVQTATTDALRSDPLITTAKLKEIEFTSFPKGGYAKSTYDKSTGLFTTQFARYVYDPTTFKGMLEPLSINQYTPEQYREFYNTTINTLRQQQAMNMPFENKLAAYNKANKLKQAQSQTQ